MQSGRALAVVCLLLAAALPGSRDARLPVSSRSDGKATTTMGGYGPGPNATAAPALLDAQGRPIPLPPVRPGAGVRAVRSGDDSALAVWVQDGDTMASSYAGDTGWTQPQPLERIYGEASDPELASNGRGMAMAVWRHTVGSIQSLRFSRFDATSGWSTPDVMPGALPRPRIEGAAAAQDRPRLRMDADGNVTARWRSGFNAAETQLSRYVPGRGWSPAVSEEAPLAANGSQLRPAPSPAL